jgi:heat-inducible transcriptional repressor
MEDRKAALLRAIVEQYIETHQPVGSGRIASRPDVSVSPATVRSEMASLEAEGYLAQPHTSAGRIPTEKGYRFFVDRLSTPGTLGEQDAKQVRAFFRHAHGELENLLHETSNLLSTVTDLAAVVVGPATETAVVRSVQLVSLSPTLALAVVVFSNGRVEKHTVETPPETTEEALEQARQVVLGALDGRSLATEPELTSAGDAVVDELADLVVRVLVDPGHRQGEPVYVGGTAQVVSRFEAVETIGRILGLLEQQYMVVTLLRDVLDRGLSVAIGSETGVANLAECSVVVAPYEVEGETLGTIGVLGPTRMNYSQAMAAVTVVSSRLGRALGEG